MKSVSGSNFVYAPVEASTVSARAAIPSDATAIEGIYYRWNESGFVGVSWFFIDGSPLVKFGITDQAGIEQYFETHTDLDEVFQNWNPNKGEFNSFYDLVREQAYDCYDTV